MSRFINRKSIATVFIALALVAGVAAGFAFHSDSIHRTHAASAAPTTVKGTGTLGGSYNLKTMSIPSPSGKKPSSIKVNRTFNPGSSSSAGQQRSSNAPATTDTPLGASGAGTLLQNFNGVSSGNSEAVNGFGVEPPDQGLCVGTGVVVELVNLAGSVYNTSGTLLLGPIPLNLFFSESATEFIGDPRCFFDKSTDTFFLTVLAIDPGNAASHIDVAVLTPLLTGTVYQFNTSDLANPNCVPACFADQPYIGIDTFNLYVSGNEFQTVGPYFGGAELFAISKSQLVAMGPLPNFAEFLHISDVGGPIATLQPALTYDPNAPAEYLLHSFTVDASGNNNSFDHRLGVFAITNQTAVTAGGFPTLSNPTIINSEFYAQPNFAPNPNGNVLAALSDDRMQQVEYINGNLMGSLDTAVNIKGDTAVRDGLAWFDIEPSLSGSLTVKAHVKQQGYIAAKGLYLLYPAITQSSDGTVEMAFSLSNSTTNPSAAYTVVPSGKHGKNAGQILVAASGTGPDTGLTCGGPTVPCRWGDYSAAVLDPGSTNIWFAAEYIPPLASQGAVTNWGTEVYEVKA